MPIENIQLNVADVARSFEFYRDFLAAVPVSEPTGDRAVLDVVTATIELVRAGSDEDSTWTTDDLQRGFRHVGFKVSGLDALAERLRDAGVPFHLDPLEAEGDVRITFFFDPDGTLLELVERDLKYNTVVDEELVAAEYALGVPERPRFDHVALTVDDFEATRDHYSTFDFRHHGTILQPHDTRGFRIDYLKGGDTVLEVFTYQAPKELRAPQTDAPGYVAARLTGAPVGDASVGDGADGTIYADADGFTYTVAG
ncbi:VOC family protein [Humibacter sp. RRB41]|uniref:VOC family protein n=1 Tax=Humibacter sp. RRB41 TaxID=2919946 RepID=UPI001FAAFFFB|nr:VOC family protein [Humibacter sp. RRB41]